MEDASRRFPISFPPNASNLARKFEADPAGDPGSLGDLTDVVRSDAEPASDPAIGPVEPRRLFEFRRDSVKLNRQPNPPEGEYVTERNVTAHICQGERLPRVRKLESLVPGRITKLRKSRSETQSQFGRSLDVDQGVVSNWERGKNLPQPKMLLRMAGIAEGADKLFFLGQAGVPEEYFHGAPMLPELVRASTEVISQSLAEGERDGTSVTFARTAQVATIPLIRNPCEVGTRDAVNNIEHVLALPSEWIPQNGHLQAARFPNPGSPLIEGDLIGLIDINHRDADRLLGCAVAVRVTDGLEAMKLSKDGGDYFLSPFRSGATPRRLRPSGEGSIVGRIVKWIADTPEPVIPSNTQLARKLRKRA
jgi:transcriptional regulator with XRE-family HTH domain